MDVELGATFTLVTESPDLEADLPEPLVALDFGTSGEATKVANTGTSKESAPNAEIISALRSNDVPAGSRCKNVFFSLRLCCSVAFSSNL